MSSAIKFSSTNYFILNDSFKECKFRFDSVAP